MPQPKLPRRSSPAEISLLSEPHIQPQQHQRFSSSPSRPVASSLVDAKMRSTHSHGTHGSRISPQSREIGSIVRSSRPQRENIERTSRVSSTESQHRSGSAPSNHEKGFPALRTRDIIKSPRLQQVTGLLPRKVDLWADRVLPPEELYRLAWAMALPEPFPTKRPRGEILVPTALKTKKT
ncbi:hypothetical protein F5Y12DRAFT_713343 [Xylaria sp. FL1777]|nr:hypothetical protein F5Y12DRAFT_713343 [Xylaria sp. FL1777]